jgi:hypothetical protein
MHNIKITFQIFLEFKEVNSMANEERKPLKMAKRFTASDSSQTFQQLPFF